MATLTVTKTYVDASLLSASDLDGIVDSIETFLNTTLLNGDNIQDGGVTSAALTANSVTSDILASDSVEEAGLADAAVETTQLGSGAAETADIADAAVTTAKILDATVATADIADSAVTYAELEERSTGTSAGNVAFSSAVSSFTHTVDDAFDDTAVYITDLQVTLTTTGKPLVVGLMGTSAGNAKLEMIPTTAPVFKLQFELNDDLTKRYEVLRYGDAVTTGPTQHRTPGAASEVFFLAAGTHTVKARISIDGYGIFALGNVKMYAYEDG